MLLFLFYLSPYLFTYLPQIQQENEFLDTSSSTPNVSPSASLSPKYPSNKGLSATWIIIIVVSVVVIGSVLITLLVFWIIKKAKTKYGHDLEENLMGDNLNTFHQDS